MMDKVERVKELLAALGLTQSQFAAECGIDKSNFNNILRGVRSCGPDISVRICLTWTDVNLIWLETGRGTMFRSPSQRQPVTDSLLRYLLANLNEAYEEKKMLRAEIKRLSDENETLRIKLSDKT